MVVVDVRRADGGERMVLEAGARVGEKEKCLVGCVAVWVRCCDGS